MKRPGPLDPVDRRILALAIPALGTLAVEPLYVLADTAIVGHLGTTPLAALALAGTVLNTVLWACNFLQWGTTARVAFLTGREDRKGAAASATQALWLGIGLGVAAAVGVAALAPALATALGGTGAVRDQAVTYLRISAISMPAVLIAVVGQGHLRGLSDTKTPFLVVLVANAVNVVLELVFVYSFHWGIAGSAWGTVIAQLLAAAWFLGIIGRLVARAGARLRPVVEEMRLLLGVGGHLVIRTGALLAALAVATAVAARVGPTTLAAHQIAYQMFIFLSLVMDSLALSVQAIVGTQLGAADVDGGRTTSRRAMRLGFMAAGVLCVVVVATSPLLPHVFTSDPNVIDKATIALLFLGVMQLPGAVVFVLDGVLMGGSDFAYVKWVTVISLFVFLPFAGAVLVWHSLGIAMLWAGLFVWITSRAWLNWVRFRGPHWTAISSGHSDVNDRARPVCQS
ncbi:MAG: MATE family efflux transporter [Acidimicrobiia bacterium]|nr:MATE family efflux transporter [Acidimicrobiia bacterium]